MNVEVEIEDGVVATAQVLATSTSLESGDDISLVHFSHTATTIPICLSFDVLMEDRI